MSDRDTLQRLNGFFVGSLSTSELDAFDRCVKSGDAYRSYEGAAALMGLAKVRLVPIECSKCGPSCQCDIAWND